MAGRLDRAYDGRGVLRFRTRLPALLFDYFFFPRAELLARSSLSLDLRIFSRLERRGCTGPFHMGIYYESGSPNGTRFSITSSDLSRVGDDVWVVRYDGADHFVESGTARLLVRCRVTKSRVR